MQFSPFVRCLDCGVCVAIRLVRFGYNPSTGRIALRVAPISPFPLKREPTRLRSRGNTTRLTQSVTIAIPSLRSLRSRHNQRHFSYYATRSQAKETALAYSLVLIVKSDARCGRRLAAPIPSPKWFTPQDRQYAILSRHTLTQLFAQ